MKMTGYVVIDVGGLGYKVFMSEVGIEKLGNIGETVKVHTYYKVREDDISIYGFNTLEELSKYFVLDYNKVKDAADSYNKLMAFGKDTEFNKDVDAMIGAQEPTLLTSAKNILGIRHFYAGYQFNNNGSLVTGKMDAPSVLSAFFSEILDLDGGGNGFGGIGTGIRRFQIQYRTPFGLDFALIEYDLVYGRQTVAKAEYIPRVAVSYTYKKDGLYAKIAGTYGILNGELVDIKSANTNSSYGTVHAFHIGGAVKKIIRNFHFSAPKIKLYDYW